MTAHVLPRLYEPRRLRNPFVSAQEEVRTAEPHLFSDSQLYALLVPIIIERFLNALMGMAGSIFMIRVLHLGILSVWIGMFMDWGVRAIIYRIHFVRGKWLERSVIG